MSSTPRGTTRYADAGVSIDRGSELVARIKPLVKAATRPGVMGELGGFGALFDLSRLNYRHPVLVSGTDGVGTKIRLANESGNHDDIGIDLVAMCVNDLLVQGAEPLFFLDYYVCERLDVDIAARVVAGITRGCAEAGCALIGGETAEHPGTFPAGEYDLAGFCVGIVEKDGIIDGRGVAAGDALIGLASSGPHSNGFSLIRKLLADTGTGLSDPFDGASFAAALLAPTRIYVKPVLELIRTLPVKAIAHITGGGLLENIPRVLPAGITARLDCASWQWPAIFHWLRGAGNVEPGEMYRTFNCGVGLVLVVNREDAERACGLLAAAGEEARVIGAMAAVDGPAMVELTNLPDAT